jgi:hypothetical protein
MPTTHRSRYFRLLSRIVHGPIPFPYQMSVSSKKPVRVVRGWNGNSKWAPAHGYRYDGLYIVEKVRAVSVSNPAPV